MLAAKAAPVIRGGAGIFYNQLPESWRGLIHRNSPEVNTFDLTSGPIAPGVPGGLFRNLVQTNQQFLTAFNNGANLSQIRAIYPGFNPSVFATQAKRLNTPQYQEWNLEVQQQLGGNVTLSVNYVGNHGIHGLYTNIAENAYCPADTCGGASFLPTTAPNPLFSTITDYQTGTVSSYNGLVASVRKRMSYGLTFGVNYTWSHALDEISNGGILPFDASTNASILTPINPYNLRQYNYGNNDADIRHYFSANYLWDDFIRRAYHGGPRMIFGDWTVGGTLFYRTGLPFSVVDSASTEAIAGFNYGSTVLATITGPEIIPATVRRWILRASGRISSLPLTTVRRGSEIRTGISSGARTSSMRMCS